MGVELFKLQLHVIGYKHMGEFDDYPNLVAEAFRSLKDKLPQIPSRTYTAVAMYEPQRGPEHTEGFFYVGVVVSDRPEILPEGSELLLAEGLYAGASGQIKHMGAIYDEVAGWIQQNGYKQIWPDTLFIERYRFPFPDQLTLDEEVEVLLPIEPQQKRI